MNKREIKNNFKNIMVVCVACFSILILVMIFGFIIKESVPAISREGFKLFSGMLWYPTHSEPEYGLAAMFIGSLLITLLTAVIVLPLGYIIAFFMYGYAKPWEKNIIKSSIDLLSGVPSVIIGSFLLVYVAPIFFKLGAWSRENILLGAVGLTILSLPYTASLMEEAMSSVDKSMKEGALALGATKFRAGFSVISKAAMPGLMNAVILTLNRIIGETMVVLMASGGAAIIPMSLWDPVRPLTAAIASEMGEVELGSIHYSSLFAAGLVLLTISFILTLISKKISRRSSK